MAGRSNGAVATGFDPELHYRMRQLREAVREQDLVEVINLLSMGVDLFSGQEASMLCIATRRANLDILKALLVAGANPDQFDRRSSSHKSRNALMEASSRNWRPGMQVLIEHGADLDLVDEHGATALLLAVKHGSSEAISLLLESGARASVPEAARPSVSPLHEVRDRQTLDRLVVAGAILDEPDRNGMTPLHCAVRAGTASKDPRRALLPVVSGLLEYGANANAQDHAGRTPLFYIVTRPRNSLSGAVQANGAASDLDPGLDIARALLSHGADLSHRDRNGDTVFDFMRSSRFASLGSGLEGFLRQLEKLDQE